MDRGAAGSRGAAVRSWRVRAFGLTATPSPDWGEGSGRRTQRQDRNDGRPRHDRHDASREGAEFRAVAVMACDYEVLPLQERIETVSDDADLEEVYNTERHLLYVACTRARDHLIVTGVDPASEFLDDLLA